MSQQERCLGAFLGERLRAGLSLKMAARLARCSPQSIYAWRVGARLMRRKSARQLAAATAALRRLSPHARYALSGELRAGKLNAFLRLVAAVSSK